MGFCKLSSEYLLDYHTLVDNLFINEYLPFAPEEAVRVYLFGLYQCSNPSGSDNSVEAFSVVLGLTANKIINAFRYWDEQGIVKIIKENPLEVKFLPVKSLLVPPKKYNPGKYEDFNKQAQKLFPVRQLTPAEYNLYYELIESDHIEPEALIMIMQYCINEKGINVRCQYIAAVAKSWIREGIKTHQDVESRLQEYEILSDSLHEIFKALGRKSTGGMEDREMFLKWTKSWGFDLSCIIFAAKKAKKGGIKRLDNLLDEYYRLNIFSPREMDAYNKQREDLYDTAKDINKIIGVYYESLDNVVETYISQWLNKGFDRNALTLIAQYCFKTNIRTLEGMNSAVANFYESGCVTGESVKNYLNRLRENDAKISEVLRACGMSRNVNPVDREYYNNWNSNWAMGHELILYAAALATDKFQPLPYINQVLSSWRENKVSTIEEAKRTSPKAASQPAPNKNSLLNSIINERLVLKLQAETRARENYEKALQNQDFGKADADYRTASLIALKKNDGCKATKDTLKELLSTRNEILHKLGMSDKDFEPVYSCKICNDTAYVNGKLCDCVREELSAENKDS